MKKLTIPNTEIIIQDEIKKADTELEINNVIDDFGCVMANFTFAGKQFQNMVLWDENSKPSYKKIGNWTDADVEKRIIELLK